MKCGGRFTKKKKRKPFTGARGSASSGDPLRVMRSLGGGKEGSMTVFVDGPQPYSFARDPLMEKYCNGVGVWTASVAEWVEKFARFLTLDVKVRLPSNFMACIHEIMTFLRDNQIYFESYPRNKLKEVIY